jgi:uncharacterized surface protein with fasciclin (FAS1) repeats
LELSSKSGSLPTLLNGQSITVEKVGKSIYVTGHKQKGAKGIDVDIIASNGVIDVIVQVLLPTGSTSSSKSSKETTPSKSSKEQGCTKEVVKK